MLQNGDQHTNGEGAAAERTVRVPTLLNSRCFSVLLVFMVWFQWGTVTCCQWLGKRAWPNCVEKVSYFASFSPPKCCYISRKLLTDFIVDEKALRPKTDWFSSLHGFYVMLALQYAIRHNRASSRDAVMTFSLNIIEVYWCTVTIFVLTSMLITGKIKISVTVSGFNGCYGKECCKMCSHM